MLLSSQIGGYFSIINNKVSCLKSYFCIYNESLIEKKKIFNTLTVVLRFHKSFKKEIKMKNICFREQLLGM